MAQKHPMAQNPSGKSNPQAKKSGKSGSKASTVITLGTIGVVALVVIGSCAAVDDDYEEVNADCVNLGNQLSDGTYEVVDDDYCDDDGYHGSRGAYGWYYGGFRSGTKVSKGTTVKPSDVSIVSRNGTVIQRGGFGGRGGSGS
ncbi:hypothetical protein [Planobispora longispora]|uniref:Uncharacterized protein n=1 Tax=Planobispora longispora TaxID=28887 RepID=A0A8J3RLM1_9ACTN|nr:hypothetical protein [Planobispora longispora]GIH76401.1 hypothetical protein Plo01_28300 [Planobispora longispora]